MISNVRINFSIDDQLHVRAKHAAIDLRMTLREFVEQAIQEKVERVERDEAERGKRPKK
jgi:predicted HicB family RNase H-like nuclease